MSSAPKKAAPKKSTPKAAPKKSAATDGVELARLRRLARAGFKGANRCALLGIRLEVGARAKSWQVPVQFGDDVMSHIAVVIMESGVQADDLDLAAARLRKQRAM